MLDIPPGGSGGSREPLTSRITGSLILILAGVLIANGGLDWLLRRGRRTAGAARSSER